MTMSRRTLTFAGAGIVAAAAIGGIAVEVPRLMRPRARGQYADLVNHLSDPAQAAIVGRAVPAGDPKSYDALRQRLSQGDLTAVLVADAAKDDVSEVSGWVLPASLATLCQLAAQSL